MASPEDVVGNLDTRTEPMFVLQGASDDNVLPALQERFVAASQAADGEIDGATYPGAEHRWLIHLGLQTDRAPPSTRSRRPKRVGGARC